MPDEDVVFIDTSIVIARLLHSPETKRRIQERLRNYRRVVTCSVVKQEYKRRLLKEARYLLEQLDRLKSATALMRHLIDRLPPRQFRKRNIGLQMVQSIDEQDGEEDRTDRLRYFLHALLRDGLEEFDALAGVVANGAQCACAQQPIKRRGREGQRFDFGREKCSEVRPGCGIEAFLRSQAERLRAILTHLQGIPTAQKTDELRDAERFLLTILADPSKAPSENPCLKVGDLIIALESACVPVFFTLNGKESQHLCRPLGQELIVRPSNPELADTVCKANAPEWPSF